MAARRRCSMARKSAVRARKAAPAKRAEGRARAPTIARDVPSIVETLKGLGSERFRADMSARFGIRTAETTYGVSLADIQKLAKGLGRSHDLAAGLWKMRCYEARLLAAFVDEPERVTAAQMDRWAGDFDNWGTCDTLC